MELYIIAGGVMVRMVSNILTITSFATIYSFHPTLIPTIFDTYLSRIIIDFMKMAF
jgi:hypothetical protein